MNTCSSCRRTRPRTGTRRGEDVLSSTAVLAEHDTEITQDDADESLSELRRVVKRHKLRTTSSGPGFTS